MVNAARQWHAIGAVAQRKLRVTLIDLDAQEIAAALVVRVPSLQGCCELTPLDMDVRSAAFQAADFLASPGVAGTPARVFVCLDDDSLCLSTALVLVCPHRDRHLAVVVRLAQGAGLAVLLREGAAGPDSFQRLRAFGLLDRTCHPEQVLRGTHEILARAIHEDYLKRQVHALMGHESVTPVYFVEAPDSDAQPNAAWAEAVTRRVVTPADRPAWEKKWKVWHEATLDRLNWVDLKPWPGTRRKPWAITSAVWRSANGCWGPTRSRRRRRGV